MFLIVSNTCDVFFLAKYSPRMLHISKQEIGNIFLSLPLGSMKSQISQWDGQMPLHLQIKNKLSLIELHSSRYGIISRHGMSVFLCFLPFTTITNLLDWY